MKDSTKPSSMDERGLETTVFTEVQRCTWWPLWVAVIGADALAITNFIVWSVRGTGIGNVPPNSATWIISFIVLALITVPQMMLKLTTRITDSAIYVRLSPPPLNMMHPNRFTWNSVRRAYVRECHWFKEYGGFGVRFGNPSVGEAISMNGNCGLQLELDNGQKIFISTRKPEELNAALVRLKTQGLTTTFEQPSPNARQKPTPVDAR
jgi:hypothetical protein